MKLFKKITGYTLNILSIILAIAIIGQLPRLIQDIVALLKALPSLNFSYELGRIIYWVFHFTLTIILWKYGRKLRKGTSLVANVDEQLLNKFGKENEAQKKRKISKS
jgi:hypothetical protein